MATKVLATTGIETPITQSDRILSQTTRTTKPLPSIPQQKQSKSAEKSKETRKDSHSHHEQKTKNTAEANNDKEEEINLTTATPASWTLHAKHAKKMLQKYQIIKPLDKGSFGEVSLATLLPAFINTTGRSRSVTPSSGCGGSWSATISTKKQHHNDTIYVIKKIDKEKASDSLITNEIEAGTRLLEHEGIPRYVETYIDSKYCYIVFEYFNGVNLYTYLEERNFKPMKEPKAKRLFRQIHSALIYCHQQGVCHRDLKLENIMYNKKKKQAKLIDFGLCAITRGSCNDLCNNWCGSPDYVCPEILLQQDYSGCLSDVWSLGVILYVLLFGQMPFNFKERFHALQNDMPHPPLEFPTERNSRYRVSDNAKDLVRRMLAFDPKSRISMEEISSHKWLTKKSPLFNFFGIEKRGSSKSAVAPPNLTHQSQQEQQRSNLQAQPHSSQHRE